MYVFTKHKKQQIHNPHNTCIHTNNTQTSKLTRITKDACNSYTTLKCHCAVSTNLYPVAMATGWLSVGYIRNICVII